MADADGKACPALQAQSQRAWLGSGLGSGLGLGLVYKLQKRLLKFCAFPIGAI